MMQDTIVALATGEVLSAISVIRLSGKEAWPILASVFRGKTAPEKWKAGRAYFGTIQDDGKILDEVIAVLFKAPASFTGEDTVEISCHGSPFIRKSILELCIRKGARPAKAGEFTQRAFLHGKMDLSQAEAVADLIASENEASHQVALQQLRGGFKSDLQIIRTRLLDFASLVELELDFSEEDVEFANRQQLTDFVEESLQRIRELRESFSVGNVLKNGVSVVLAGRPNAGKSTLFNALLREERAIVSDIAGTTRDTIEEVIHIGGIAFRLIDTAGIREATDTIEHIGIGKTFEKIREAAILLYIADISQLSEADIETDLSQFPEGTEVLIIANKIDCVPEPAYWTEKEKQDTRMVVISAKEGKAVESIRQRLQQYIQNQTSGISGTLVTNSRHVFALLRAEEALARVHEGLQTNLPGDLIAMDIRQTLHHLGEITGEITNDELLGNIFGKFCIGK